MEAEVKQARWVLPILIATITAVTLIALVSWVQVVFGGFMPGIAPFNGGMMGNGGMMMNTANTGPAGGATDMSAHMKVMMGDGDMAKNCAKMQSDPKSMGANHDRLHRRMHGNSNTTDKTL